MLLPSEFHQVFDAETEPLFALDHAGRVTGLNRAAEQFFGWPASELLGEPMSRLIPTRLHSLLGASPTTATCFARRRDGRISHVELTAGPLGVGPEGHLLLRVRDLTLLAHRRDARPWNNDQALAALESIGDAVITTDVAGRITFLNAMAESVTGWDADDALGQPLDAVLLLISEASREPVENTAARCLEEERAIDLESGVLLLRPDGTEVPIGDSAAPIVDRSGRMIGVVLVIQNESEKRRVGHRLSYEATHDPLTGLLNRREFERRLGRVIADLGSGAGEHVLLCLDLDGFKSVNDDGGHEAGDDLLRSLGAVFNRQMRKRDTMARLGGDEFGVLLENCPLVEGERIAESLRAGVERFGCERAGQSYGVTASIGAILVTAAAGGIAEVLRAADAACYAAKSGGGNRLHRGAPAEESIGFPLAMAHRVTRLARAIDESHFQLYAQPIVALDGHGPHRPRFEILLRLPDGRGGVQTAGQFLPQAARLRLMPAIDRWVIRETVALLGGWLLAHPGAEPPVCSINLSPSALSEDDLFPALEQSLARHAIPRNTLCFEIAEAAALADVSRTVRFLSGVRAAGCGVGLDDIGSGVTSFTYLKTLPVDFLKIGGRFVRGVVDDPMHASIVRAVDQIGKSQGVFTIAKQVGSRPVLQRLRALGIAYAQGRAVSHPVPLTDANGRVELQSLQLSA